MAKKKMYTAKLMKLAVDLPTLIDALESQITQVCNDMATLKKTELIYATEHWRKDREGQLKYAYLLYHQKNNEPRRREYIGCNAERIKEARAGIGRAIEYDTLAAQHTMLINRLRCAAHALHDARHFITGA